MKYNDENKSEISDGYHTFNELYDHRHHLYCALLMSNLNRSWKSKLHDDGTMFEGYFIAGMYTPNGTITYHMPMHYWGLIHSVKTLEKAPYWDGHTPDDVLYRLSSWLHIMNGTKGPD